MRDADASDLQLSPFDAGVTLVAHAVARMVPVVVFALFGYILMASGLRHALAEALKSADVLVTGGFAVAGWLLSAFLDSVEKRFDKVDKQFDKVQSQFEKLTDLIMLDRKQVKP